MEDGRGFKGWQQARKHILRCLDDCKETFVSFKDLAKMFDCPVDSAHFQFNCMRLEESLLTEHKIVLLRLRNAGFKVASSVEIVEIKSKQYNKSGIKKFAKQSLILQAVDPTDLDEETTLSWERQLTRNSMFLTYMMQHPLKKIEPGLPAKLDRVKLIEMIEDDS